MNIEFLIYAILILFIVFLILKFVKKLIINTIFGLILLYVLNLTIFSNNPIPINIVTILISALFGVPGVLTLAVLNYFNYI